MKNGSICLYTFMVKIILPEGTLIVVWQTIYFTKSVLDNEVCKKVAFTLK